MSIDRWMATEIAVHQYNRIFSSVQLSRSVMSDSLRPHGLQHARPPCHHQLPELAQIHVHWVGDAVQPSHPLSFSSPPAFNLSQHQGLFQWVSSSYQVAKVLEFQLQHQSFQWIFRVYFLMIDGLVSLYKRLARVFSSAAVKNYQFFSAQPSFWSNWHISTWLLEKP